MKKKLLALVISVMTVSMLVGCGSKEDTVATDNTEIEAIETTASSDDNADVAEEEKEEDTTNEEVTDIDTTEDIPEEVNLETETTPVVETATVANDSYTYKDLDITMYAKSTVNVRDLPSTDGKKLGGLSQNDTVYVTGQCNETSWYRFEFNGTVAYVSNSYLVDSPVEVSAPAATSTTTTSSSSGLTRSKVIKMIDNCCTPPDTLTGRYIIEPEGRYSFEVVPGLWVHTYYGYEYKDHVGGMQQRVPTIEYDKYPDGYYYAPRDYPGYDPNWTPGGTILTEPAIAF